MSTIQLKSWSLEEVIGQLSQLDTSSLNYIVASLQKVQKERTPLVNPLMMKEEEFWSLMEQIDWSKKKGKKCLNTLVKKLASLPIAKIHQFSERLAFLLHQLDGPAYLENLKNSQAGVSADTFLYTRCLVVAKGKNFFYHVLNNPKAMPIDDDFEALLYVAKEAFELKTDEKYNYIPTIIYESFFNKKLWGDRAISL